MKKKELQSLAKLMYELGTLRKISRMHRQLLLTDDLSDNTANHTFRVAMLGYIVAKMERVDPFKVVMMCLLHDTGDTRSNDHNWVHKGYMAEDGPKIIDDQLGQIPIGDLYDLAKEYHAHETREARVAKDADILDQICLLREYEHQGNKEAKLWLMGKDKRVKYFYLENMTTSSAVKLGRALYNESPSSWWAGLSTRTRRAMS